MPTVLAFFHSQEFLNRNTSNAQFVTICYRSFLGRDPDPDGLNAFLFDLQSDLFTRDNLLDIFLDSQEFKTQASFLPPLDPPTEFVITLYVRILGRGPDLAGRQGWVAQLQATHQALPVVQTFLASPEFLARNTTNAAFVTLLYRVFLNRVPDTPGLTGFVAALDQGTVTRDQLVAQFATSPEFQAIQQQLFGSAPDIRGTYSVFGVITQSNCLNPDNNGVAPISSDSRFRVTAQTGSNFSGSATVFIPRGVLNRVEATFSGTVTPDGRINATFTGTTFVNNVAFLSSTGTIVGTAISNTIGLTLTGQTVVGETCTFTASLSGNR